MPILPNAKKALRRDKRRNQINILVKDNMKAAIKAVKEKKDAKLLPAAYQAIDRATKKNLLHHNKAARLKSQLSKLLQHQTSTTTKTTTKKSPSKSTKTPKKTSTPKTKPRSTSKASK